MAIVPVSADQFKLAPPLRSLMTTDLLALILKPKKWCYIMIILLLFYPTLTGF